MESLLFFIGILLIILICCNTKLLGGAPFSIGTRVNTNPYLTEDKEDLIVLDSDNKYSKVRPLKSREVFNIRNDFLMKDPIEMCDIRKLKKIVNEGYSCWLDSVMFAFIVPDEIFMYFQEAVYNKKNDDLLSLQDFKVVNAIQQYIDTLRYSAGYKELKRGIGIETISAFRTSIVSSCRTSLMQAFRSNIEQSIHGELNPTFFIAFLIRFFKMNVNLVVPIEDYSNEFIEGLFNDHTNILTLGSKNDSIIPYIRRIDPKYELISIVVLKKMRRAQINGFHDYLDESKSHLFFNHVICIVKCLNKWIYYDDNGYIHTIDDPLPLFADILDHLWIKAVLNEIIDDYDLIIETILIFTQK